MGTVVPLPSKTQDLGGKERWNFLGGCDHTKVALML